MRTKQLCGSITAKPQTFRGMRRRSTMADAAELTRVVDGAEAVRFGNAFIKYLEDPDLLEML